MQPVGIIKQINLYPVKSMRGTSVQKAECSWYGLEGDRKYAFVHDDVKSGFPWLTGRELPELLQYQPSFVTPDRPMQSVVNVKTPSNNSLDLASDELRSELLSSYGRKVSLIKLKRGTFDCMPISILTETAFENLQKSSKYRLDIDRFRANIIVETDSDARFPELDWVNHTLSFGNRSDAVTDLVSMQVNYPAERCMMVNLDPETGESTPSVLKTVVNEASGCFSVYASVKQMGSIEVGDSIFLT